MNIWLIFLMIIITSCSTTQQTNPSTLTISAQYPSTDKAILAGLPIDGGLVRKNNIYKIENYDLLQRLAKTVWYQTEREYDDGKFEVETEYVFFNDKSWIVERESENGIMERVEYDDYRKATWIQDVPLKGETLTDGKTTESRNAMIAMVKEIGDDIEFEGYYLHSNASFENGKYGRVLYIVEGDSLLEVQTLLTAIINNPELAQFVDSERYVLSTTPSQVYR